MHQVSLMKLRDLLLLAVLAGYSLFLFPQLRVLAGNTDFIDVAMQDLLLYSTLFSLVVTMLAFVIWFFFRSGRLALGSILFIVCIGTWLQSAIMVWDFGLLDGHEIVWTEHVPSIAFEIAAWIAICGAAYVFRRAIEDKITLICVALLLLNVVGTVFVGEGKNVLAEARSSKLQEANPSRVFELSEDRNLIVLIFDTFDAYAYELVSTDERFADTLSDFTFYQDTTGGYPTTYPSIPLMLSGEFYKNEKPLKDFLENDFRNNNVLNDLVSSGVNTKLVSSVLPTNSLIGLPGVEVVQRSGFADQESIMFGNFLKLTDIGLFRATPFPVRYLVYNRQEWFLSGLSRNEERPLFDHGLDVDIVKAFLNSANKGGKSPGILLIHFITPHPPIRISDSLVRMDGDLNVGNFKQQAAAALEMLGRIKTKLKQIGAYDDSTIVVAADHGANHSGLAKQLVGLDGEQQVISSVVLTAARPLLLIKSAGRTADYSVDDAPFSYANFSSLLWALGKQDENPAQVIHASRTSGNRYYYHYEWTNDGWAKAYLPPMTEYIINGPVTLPSSWSKTGWIYTETGRHQISKYSIGEIVQFGLAGSARLHLIDGWSSDQDGYVWTVGHESKVVLPIEDEQIENNLVLNVRMYPYLAGGALSEQRVEVLADNESIGGWRVSGLGSYKIALGQQYLADGNLSLTFRISDPISPRSAGISDDGRLFGVAVRELSIEKVALYELPVSLRFGKGTGDEAYVGSGWSGAEQGYRWTIGSAASLLFGVDGKIGAQHCAKILARPFKGSEADAARIVRMSVNGEEMGTMQMLGANEYLIPIPLPSNTPHVTVDFHIDNPRSPASLGLSNDERQLGFAIERFNIENGPCAQQ